MKPTKYPAREKKMSKNRQKRREQRKRKLSAHAQTSQADILHLHGSEDREVYDL